MIHQYEMAGLHIVVDAGSGSIHVVDPPAYEAIRLLDAGCGRDALLGRLLEAQPGLSARDAEEVLADIDSLVGQKRLFSEDPYAGIAGHLPRREPVLKALCLLVSHTCNLACSYCFASQGHFEASLRQGGPGSCGKPLMDYATGKQALDFLIAHSGTRRHLEVDFFGGEPLLNFPLCKALVAYARSVEAAHGKEFRFTLTTNGIGVTDEVIDWANAECYNVVLSLDGRQEVHDRFRRDNGGQGSYQKIVPLFRRFVEKRQGQGYYMRGTYTRYNTDFTKDIFHMADELGFRQLSMEPVVASPDAPYALREEDLPALYAEYEALALDMLRRERAGEPITFYHYMLDLQEGPCIYKRISGCGSGTEYLAVTAGGDLYPCHQFASDPDYRLGDVWHGITEKAKQEEFQDLNIYSRPGCADCWARLYCAGGCSANALHSTGELRGTYDLGCALFRKRLECAIMLKAAAALPDDPAV